LDFIISARRKTDDASTVIGKFFVCAGNGIVSHRERLLPFRRALRAKPYDYFFIGSAAWRGPIEAKAMKRRNCERFPGRERRDFAVSSEQ
jgi:hypothetical protein